ncbi:MAG: endonuclease/exonuclease/phosphatase family protein [Saprospiraceae bacterium]|nr:endonuclease/exonuclease/phosphatase family protein [Saprospiraceae bacterium]
MKPILKRTLKVLGLVLSLFSAYIGVILVHGTLVDYQAPPQETLQAAQTAAAGKVPDSVISLAIWNLGYTGLGAEADFFFDNGRHLSSGPHMVRPPRELTDKFEAGIEQWMMSTQADFFLLQEVDLASRRSYYINQFERLQAQKPGFSAYFAVNYLNPRVPLPLLEPWNPYGAVHSGLATYSRFQPSEATRYQLPGSFGWPMSNFQLDRCLAVFRYPVKGGKDLVVINVHNSAHDRDGRLKKQEMAYLKDLLLKEYEKGNYVIAGGDWNQCPPFFRFDGFMPGRTQGYVQLNIPDDFLPTDWRWVYDPTVPTNRKARKPYKPGETFVTIIDFFLISPNVKVKSVKCMDLQFQFSDHQPVWMEVELVTAGN